MDNSDQTANQVDTAAPGTPEPTKPKPKRGQSKRNARGDGEGNRQRPRNDRNAMSGFGDGIERAFCIGIVASPPRSFPAQHRSGLAVLTPVVVAREESSMLYCDCEHDGPHIWPNGDIVDTGD